MKILLITNDFPPMVGGEATYYDRLCATPPPDRILVLAPRLPGDEAFDSHQPYRVFRRWAPTSPHPLARLTQIIILLAHALRIVRRERIDEVHIGHLYLGVVGLALKRWLNVTYVTYLHGGEMAAYMRFHVVQAVARAIVRHARLVVVNSEYTRGVYEAMGMRHPQVEVLMSVSTERFRPGLDPREIRKKYGLDDHKVVLTVGRLVERKGHDIVIRALGRVRQSVGPVRYLIAGRGPEEPRLRALARDQGCAEDVEFIGHVSQDELPYLYAACDAFVMPSRPLAQRDGIEGFGMVFLEAGACGKPVVGGRSGGMADAVLDGVTGILVDPIDVEEVARALTRLLLNPADAGRLGAEGRLRAQALDAAWGTTLARVLGRPDLIASSG